MEHSQWRRGWDKISDTPYAVNGNKVIVYDDTRSLTYKVKFKKRKKMINK